MKRVWIFNHDACSPSTGPMLRHYNFAKYLENEGYAVTIFASNRIHFNNKVINIPKGNYLRQAEDGADFVRIKTSKYRGNGVSRLMNWQSYYHRIFGVADDLIKQGEKPDVIIGSSVHLLACVAAIKLAAKLDIPAIVEIRDLWPEAVFMAGYAKENSLIGRTLTQLEHWIYKHADSIIFTKEGDKDHLIEMGWDKASGGDIDLAKCYYINNGVDLDTYYTQMNTYVLDDPDLNSNAFKVIYTGTLRAMNNVDLILDAAKLVQKEGGNAKFIIYGDGNQRERLEERKKTENINNLEFKGFVSKEYIAYILSKSSVNILNYSQKNYNWSRGNSSNKLFDYMASGKPIISTIQMGYSIIAKYNCGIELEYNTAECLANAIIRMQNLPESEITKMGENAKEGAKDFDFHKLSADLIEVIEKNIEEYRKKVEL